MNEHRAYKTKIESLEEKILTTNYTYVCDIDVVVHSMLMFHHKYIFVNIYVWIAFDKTDDFKSLVLTFPLNVPKYLKHI